MEILIRNMVCRHCIEAVRRTLTHAGFEVEAVELGRAVVRVPASMPQADVLPTVDRALAESDFERISDPDSILVDNIKHAVIAHVRDSENCRLNLSACIAQALNVSYDLASRTFSALEGRTIERYFLLARIERVKELLLNGDMTLSEIAFSTGFSSAAHLSRQFKSITGITASQFVASGHTARTGLDKV